MVDFDAFLTWAESRFGDVKVSKDEVRINSIYDPNGDDMKYKLYCSPSGGKHLRPEGVYRCWISNKIGTLVGLVMEVDHCSPEEARDTIGAGCERGVMLEQIKAILGKKKPEIAAEPPKPQPGLELPENTILINHLSKYNRNRIRAESYLENRKIPTDGFFVCTSGDFRDRIIIPYYDQENKLIYFNGRYIGNNEKVVKYLGPDKDKGVGKGDVLYCPSYPEKGQKLYITEGEFDALTLHLCGLAAASVGGSNLTEKQLKLLRPFKVVLSVDNDNPGKSALLRMSRILISNGINHFAYIRPPVGFKDWNSLLQKKSVDKIAAYVTRCEKPFTEEDAILMVSN